MIDYVIISYIDQNFITEEGGFIPLPIFEELKPLNIFLGQKKSEGRPISMRFDSKLPCLALDMEDTC